MHRLVISAVICFITTASFASETLKTEAKETITTKSGLQFTSISEGTGAVPGPESTVSVNYRGTLLNGREFDSSYRTGRPAVFRLDSVIKCWTEGLQMMKVGGKAKLLCPSNLAYGEEGILGSVPRFATLIFEVELLGIR